MDDYFEDSAFDDLKTTLADKIGDYTTLKSYLLLNKTQNVLFDGDYKFNSSLSPDTKLFGEDARIMTILEFAEAYGVKYLEMGDYGMQPNQNDIEDALKLANQLRKQFDLGPKPKMYWSGQLKKSLDGNKLFAKEWLNASREYLKGQSEAPPKETKPRPGVIKIPSVNVTGRSGVQESKNSALDRYISENKQLLKENPYNTPEYDLQRRANSYLTSIAKEMYKVAKPFEEVKKLIDAIPEWVEKQMPDDAWNSLGDLHDLSKINFQKLEIDFNRTVGPGSEVEDTEGQENVAGATDSSLRESLFQEEEREVPTTGGGTQTIDLDTLSDDQRFRAYTILRQNNYEFTDIEQVDYMQMLDDKDPGTLTTGETNYILNNTTMSQETDLEPEEE